MAALQRMVGNNAVATVVMRQVPPDRELRQRCIDGPVFTAMTDAELTETIAAIDVLLAGVTSEPERETAVDNRRTARREQARRRHPDFRDLGEGVRSAATVAARRTASEQLITWVRSRLDTYPDLVRRYRRQSTPAAAVKVATLGRAAAAVARMEFLLGTIRHRGGSWESGNNSGAMVDDYTGGAAAAWCSSFATHALQEIYGTRMRVASGYKVANPDEFPGVRTNYDADQGGAFVGAHRGRNTTAATNPFVELRETLSSIADGTDTEQTAEQAATAFMADRIQPQAGDLFVIRRGVANPNSFSADSLSHTLMVESVSGTKVSLIEGNSGAATDRAYGRVLDLAVVDDVEEVIFTSRASLTSGVSAAEAARAGTIETAAGEMVTTDQIVDPLDDLNWLLEDLARAEGDIQPGSEAGSTVAELVSNG